MMDISSTSRQPPRVAWTLERLVHERAIALGYAIDPSTSVTYTSHLQSYLTFCKLHERPIDPTVDTLSFYTVFMCHHIQPDSVDSYLSGICNQLEHLFPDIRTIRRHRLVAKTLQGCKKLYGEPSHRKDPLTTDNLRVLLAAFPPVSHDNILFAILVLVGFFALHRLGELTWPDSVKLRDSRKVIKRSSVRHYTGGFGYILPAHKADRVFEGSTIVIIESNAPADLNPFFYFNKYLASRDALFPLQPALFLTSTGAIPTRSWFVSRLSSVLTGNISGHSMRAGGATHFAAIGWPDDRIQALGRWSSEAYRIYIRKNPVVLQALLHGMIVAPVDAPAV